MNSYSLSHTFRTDAFILIETTRFERRLGKWEIVIMRSSGSNNSFTTQRGKPQAAVQPLQQTSDQDDSESGCDPDTEYEESSTPTASGEKTNTTIGAECERTCKVESTVDQETPLQWRFTKNTSWMWWFILATVTSVSVLTRMHKIAEPDHVW